MLKTANDLVYVTLLLPSSHRCTHIERYWLVIVLNINRRIQKTNANEFILGCLIEKLFMHVSQCVIVYLASRLYV